MCGCMVMHAAHAATGAEGHGHAAPQGEGVPVSSSIQMASRTCSHCGFPLQEAYAFCPGCGVSLQTKCPACGQKVEAGWRACAYCGYPLGNAQQGTP